MQLDELRVAPGKVLHIPAHSSAITLVGTLAVELAHRHRTVSPSVSAVGMSHVYEKPCRRSLTGTMADVGAVLKFPSARKYVLKTRRTLVKLAERKKERADLICVVTAQLPPPVCSEIHAPPVKLSAIITFREILSIVDAWPALVSCETLKSVHGTATESGQPKEPH